MILIFKLDHSHTLTLCYRNWNTLIRRRPSTSIYEFKISAQSHSRNVCWNEAPAHAKFWGLFCKIIYRNNMHCSRNRTIQTPCWYRDDDCPPERNTLAFLTLYLLHYGPTTGFLGTTQTDTIVIAYQTARSKLTPKCEFVAPSQLLLLFL